MFARMFQIENTRLFKNRLFWAEAAILVGFLMFFFGGMFAISQLMPNEGLEEQIASSIYWPGSLINAVGIAAAGGIGGLLIIVLSSVVVAQGYSHRTFSVWLSRGTPRAVVLLAQFAALALAAVLIVLIAALVGALISGLLTLAVHGSLPLDAVNFGQLGLSVLRTAYTLLPYVTLTMLFAVLVRSAAAALGIGIGYTLIVEGLLVQLLALVGETGGHIVKFLPSMLAQSVNSLNMSTVQLEVTLNGQSAQIPMLEPGLAAVGIAAYTLLFLGLAVWKFRRQDLTA